MHARTTVSQAPKMLQRFKKALRQLARLQNRTESDAGSRRRIQMLNKRVEFLKKRLNPFKNIRVKTRLAAIAAASLGAVSAGAVDSQAFGYLEIDEVRPAENATAAARDADIEIDFNLNLDAATVNSNNIRVYGSQSGLISNSGIFSGNPLVKFNPSKDFKPGELITVVVNEDLEGGTGEMLDPPKIYQFTAEVSGGDGTLTACGLVRTATYSKYIETGDLDGDGDLDLLHIWDDDGATFAIESLLNDGNGKFTLKQSLNLRGANHRLGDVDGDGDLDVIVPRASTSDIPVLLLNNGDGTFSSQSLGSTSFFQAAIGDLDEDGDLDIIAGSSQSNIILFRNNGDASFAESSLNLGSASLGEIEIADFDKDDDMDIVLGQASSNGSLLLKNNGDFTFASSMISGSVTASVAVGDVDGDGDIDLVVSHPTRGNGTQVLLNNGSAGFVMGPRVPQPGLKDIKLGDFDNDDDLDLIFINDSFLNNFILLNNGNGSFASTAFKIGLNNNRTCAVGDMDGDGDLDVVSALYSPQGGLELWSNDVELCFSPAIHDVNVACDADITISFPEEMNTSTLQSNADVNLANIIVHGSRSGEMASSATITYANDDTRVIIEPLADFKPNEQVRVTLKGVKTDLGVTIATASVYSFLAGAKSGDGAFVESDAGLLTTAFLIRTGDMDGDGDLDVITAPNNQTIKVLLNNGDGTLTEGFTAPATALGIEVGDVDGDGDLDIVTSGLSTFVEIFYNNGDGQAFVSTTINHPSGGQRGIDLGDMDADGDLDIVLGNSDTDVPPPNTILLNNNDGTFEYLALPSGAGGQDIAVGDLDNDGDLDIIHPHAISGYKSSIWLNNGDGSFERTEQTDGGFWEVALGDLDNDGDLDAILSGQYDYNSTAIPNAVWLNNGDGTFVTSEIGRAGDQRGVALGDVDGDGDLDAVITRMFVTGAPRDASNQLLLNNGDGTFVERAFGATNSGNRGVALGDMDGDGDLEVLVGGYTNNLEIWSNGIAPEIHSLNPACLTTTTGSLNLNLTGISLGQVTGASLTLPDNSSVNLTVASSSATTLASEIPAGSANQAGSYTLKLYDNDGVGSTSLTINAAVSISGTSCGCPETPLTYTAQPNAAVGDTDNWTVAGGTIISGQGTSTLVIEWNQGAAQNVTLNRTFADGCSTSVVKVVDPKTVIANVDVQVVDSGVPATIEVLNNDIGSSLSLLSVDSAPNGTSAISVDDVTYTSNTNFSGIDNFNYSIEDVDGCVVTSAVVMVVGNTCLPGNLQFVERHKNNKAGVRGLKSVQNTALSPDGKHLYAAGRKDHSIALFNRTSSNGTIEYVERVRNGHGGVSKLKFVSDLVLSPDGQHLYATAFGNNALVTFERNDTSGALTQINAVCDNKNGADGLKGASGLAVSPDGAHIYVAGRSEHSIAVLARDSSGMTQYRSRVKDGVGGVDGIRSVTDVAVSPDGKHVYAAGTGDNALAVFARHDTSGALTFIERLRDNKNGVKGLSKAVAVKVSADGKHVYVAANQDDAVSVFARNDSSGRLTFVEDYSDRDPGVAGLDASADVAIGPDGLQVYVSGEGDNAIGNFSRKPGNGELDFEERKKDARDGVDGLKGAKGVEVSGDSRYVYVAGAGEHAVAVFYRNLKPIARDDNATVMLDDSDSGPLPLPEEESGSVTVIDVLRNDLDIDSDPLKITRIVSEDDRTEGEISISDDSTSVEYSLNLIERLPDDLPYESQMETYTYTISDGQGGESTATLTIRLDENDEVQKRANLALTPSNPSGVQGLSLLENLNVAPNPTQGDSRINFRLNSSALIKAEVRDITGRKVTTLLNEQLKAGEYLLNWNGENSSGQLLNSGTYYIVLHAEAAGQSVQQVVPIVLVF